MKQFIWTIILLFTITSASQAQTAKRQKEFNLDNSSVGISGYDPVAYFTQGKATEGSKDFTTVHEGVIYRFASQQNKNTFNTNPTRYEPQYGGWCAYAMGAKGEKVSVDPKTFKITGGKLYLFYNKFFTNTLTSWNKDETALKTKADASWAKIF